MYIGGATALIFALFGYILGRHADELAELSETDALTHLLNARGFASRLRAEIRRAKRYREPLSVLFLDVDGLKNINDRHGHRAGSEALREVAGVIRAELRATDTGARWGGDEFTIIAPNTKRDEAVVVRRAHPRQHRPPHRRLADDRVDRHRHARLRRRRGRAATRTRCCATRTRPCTKPSGAGKTRSSPYRRTARPKPRRFV